MIPYNVEELATAEHRIVVFACLMVLPERGEGLHVDDFEEAVRRYAKLREDMGLAPITWGPKGQRRVEWD